jgi:hypothetical protein
LLAFDLQVLLAIGGKKKAARLLLRTNTAKS